MTKRFKNQLYTKEIHVIRNHQICFVENDDGTLFSGHHRTKILPEDLPKWYVYGRYYKCWGYLSTKGITDLLYIPNKFSNHFLKDDFLYIAYGGKIEKADSKNYASTYERYIGFDERICGSEIIDILKGARLYSNYDISGFIQQLKEKKEWLIKQFPEEFGHNKWYFNVEQCFFEENNDSHP